MTADTKTHVQRDVSAGGAHECAKIATQILDSLDNAHHFHDGRFMSRVMTKIRVDGVLDCVPPRDHCGSECVEMGAASRQ